jgi:hypothetical protein
MRLEGQTNLPHFATPRRRLRVTLNDSRGRFSLAARSGRWHAACCCEAPVPDVSISFHHKEITMKLTRVLFLALAVLLPATWTVAKAEDAPATDAPAKKEKKSKKKKAATDAPKDDKKAQ